MDKKRAFLLNETKIDSNEVFILILGDQTPLLPGGLWTSYYGHLQEDHILCYKVKSTGLFKKTYSIEGTYKLWYKDMQTAEFGSGNGNLWLQMSFKQGPLVFTSGGDWTSPAAQVFVQKLSQLVSVIDLGLYTKKLK